MNTIAIICLSISIVAFILGLFGPRYPYPLSQEEVEEMDKQEEKMKHNLLLGWFFQLEDKAKEKLVCRLAFIGLILLAVGVYTSKYNIVLI